MRIMHGQIIKNKKNCLIELAYKNSAPHPNHYAFSQKIWIKKPKTKYYKYQWFFDNTCQVTSPKLFHWAYPFTWIWGRCYLMNSWMLFMLMVHICLSYLLSYISANFIYQFAGNSMIFRYKLRKIVAHL